MADETRNGTHQGRRADRAASETEGVASRFRETPGNVCRLGGSMIRDLGRGTIGHKEVTSYARAAGVVLGGARVGGQIGFNRDLTGDSDGGDGETTSDELADERSRRKAELTAELERLCEEENA